MRIDGCTYHTWEDWKSQGFRVIIGERAYYRNQYGTCVFSRDQVTRSKPHYRIPYYPNFY